MEGKERRTEGKGRQRRRERGLVGRERDVKGGYERGRVRGREAIRGKVLKVCRGNGRQSGSES